MPMFFVTNKNDFTHTDRYDGEDYTFPPGQRVALSLEAARHMFGWREANKEPTLHRLGWSTRYDAERRAFVNDDEGLKKLLKFVFSEAVLVEQALPLEDDKTLHLPKKGEARA